ncbi:LytTR family DNA-binding domain-containing protein [Fibrella forsythiae]|uniref:LytTR family transcriptional regulator n=1 Tax=Fibrella forsythiae TaxID=2817061 RepID=A0ABS3JVM0_9BACT|nr:LytTR family DNA-binding domain-containing protein [Fibrella forsythiae]MBO0952967.1 LytTR family transcriptional regulator [Fibrella forsythiae]
MSPIRSSPAPLPSLHLRGLGQPLPLSQIVRFEAADNYTRVHLRGQRWPLVYGYTLGVMCQRFPFMARITKSVAVNPQQVQAITRQGVLLQDQGLVGLSRYHKKRLFGELTRAKQLAGL